MIRLLRHDPSIPREDDGAVRCDDLVGEFKVKFVGTLQWTVDAWCVSCEKGSKAKFDDTFAMVSWCLDNFPGKKRRTEEEVSILLEPQLFQTLPVFYSNSVTFRRLPSYIYHIGNVNDFFSITRSGLIPGGRSLKKDRQSVFFTAVNPTDDDQNMEEIRYNLDKPRIEPYRKYLENSPKYSFLVQAEARSKKRIAVLSNSIARNRSF